MRSLLDGLLRVGRIVLYEFDFEGQQGTQERYRQSLELPQVEVPAAAADRSRD